MMIIIIFKNYKKIGDNFYRKIEIEKATKKIEDFFLKKITKKEATVFQKLPKK